MFRFLITVFLLLFSSLVFSQNLKITSILKSREIKTEYYEMAEVGSWVLYLPMEFGKSVFTYSQKAAINKLKDAIIARIDLVYSDYPAGQDFTPLNKKRLENIERILPSVFSSSIEFRKIRQTIAKTKSTAQGLQHGFFIYFREKPTKERTREEFEKLKEMTSGLTKKSGDLVDIGKDAIDTSAAINWCGTSFVMVDTSSYYYDSSTLAKSLRWDSNWTFKKWAVRDYLKSGIEPVINQKDFEVWDSVYHIEYKGDCPDFSKDFFLYQVIDTTVSQVFRRNKWNKAMVIADVTGSMYPYTGQLLKWLAITLTDKQKRHFVFFNDGDNTDDEAKIIGKTGGIYSVYSNSYDEVEATVKKAMLSGGGGDAPENNIEALLESDDLCTDCDTIVMIADNWAPVRDILLLDKYRSPVKVVLCGVLGAIHKDYLKLVRDTKGSLHLIEEDIYNLSELKEGETIKIHGRTYKLVKGEFIDMSSLSL